MGLRALALAGLSFAILGGPAAIADRNTAAPPSPPVAALPANVAALDAALKASDYAAINRIHAAIKSGDEMVLFMNWEGLRAFEGDGFYMSYIYMTDLWGFATNMPADTPDEKSQVTKLKQSAVLVGLFAYEIALLDGTKCSDATAVSHRVDQLLTNQAWNYADQIPEDIRRRMIDHVLNIERANAAKRAYDNVLCTGGMAQMTADLAAQAASGKPAQQVPNASGTIGKTYAVPSAPVANIYVDPAVWQPRQDKLRATMPDALASLMKLTKPPAK